MKELGAARVLGLVRWDEDCRYKREGCMLEELWYSVSWRKGTGLREL